jgi:hypothetical protein
VVEDSCGRGRGAAGTLVALVVKLSEYRGVLQDQLETSSFAANRWNDWINCCRQTLFLARKQEMSCHERSFYFFRGSSDSSSECAAPNKVSVLLGATTLCRLGSNVLVGLGPLL